jgi:ribose transport system ATP-binding protein
MVEFLSGGNQQKVALAKWLCTQAKVLIFDEPTRGIDVGAKAEVFRLMNDLAKEGVGIILISSEMPEILAMSDRILVMARGSFVAEYTAGQASQEDLLRDAVAK